VRPSFLNPLWNALDFLSSGMEEDPRKGSERVISPTPEKIIPSWLPRGSTIGPRLLSLHAVQVWETCTCSHFKTDGADKGTRLNNRSQTLNQLTNVPSAPFQFPQVQSSESIVVE
jgi:hypothetical protein